MCEAIRQMRQESFSQGISQGIEQGISQGIERGRHDVAVNALLMKMSHEVVHKLTGLSLERIASIAKSMDTAQA